MTDFLRRMSIAVVIDDALITPEIERFSYDQ